MKRHRGMVDKRSVRWRVRMIGLFTACDDAMAQF